MIKAVIFDFGQTLVDSADAFRTAEKQAQKQIFENLGYTSWHEFLENYRRIRKQFYRKSNFSRKAMWQEVYWYYCRHCDDKLLEKWERQYWENIKNGTKPFPEAEPVLGKLSEKYSLGLITNTQGQPTSEKHRLSSFPKLERFFDTVIVAGENGVPPKPNGAPFRICREQIGVSARESIYVGDDWRIDVCGARDAGMHPIWIKHHLVRRNWPDVKESVPVINNLEQLYRVLHQV